MKKHLLILSLIFPLFLSAQEAFYDTKTIVENEELLLREDIQELLDIYVQKTDFDDEDKLATEHILKFMENPFGEDINYNDLTTHGFINLSNLIENNADLKTEVRKRDYELIIKCDSLMPTDYELFLEDDKIVFDADLYDCFEDELNQKYPSEYAEEDAAYEVTTPSMGRDMDASIGIPATNPLSFSTKMIDATSQFLVERVKEELLLSFFEKFFAQIDNSTELTSLMPNTYFLLKTNDIFKVPSMGEVWVSAFEEDLESLLPNLENMVTTHPKYFEIQSSPKMQYFLIAGFIFQQIKNNEGLELEEQLNSFYQKFASTDIQMIKMLGVANLLSKNLRERDYPSEFISSNTYSDLFTKKENAALYFTGLLYQQDKELFKSIKIKTASDVIDFTLQMKNHVKNFTQSVGGFLAAIQELKTSLYFYKDALTMDDFSNVEETLNFYADAKLGYVLSIFDFLDYGIELAYFKNPSLLHQSDYYQILRPLAIKTIQTYDAANRRDYGNMILQSMQMMEPLVQIRINHLNKKINLNVGNSNNNALVETTNKKLKKEIQILENVVKNYVYYGGFMIDILSAETTSEIKGIIYKYAEPAGSYRVKRQSDFSVSLSSYPGLYGGLESVKEDGNDISFVTGVTAPIGLSLNWGNKKLGISSNSHSLSLYVPIIDIGAAFSYRWKNSESEGFPENIKWQQVLSPGVHAVWGIGNSPMALMVGAQYTPLLRNITRTNNELQQNAWRFGATISVDIPILHFYRTRY